MNLKDKFPQDTTITRILFQKFEDLANYTYSIGCLYRKGPKKTHFCNKAYCCLYVISGTGVYIDEKTGKTYDITPGCVIQRLPDTAHTHIIYDQSTWCEFYFCSGKKLFETLVDIGQITDEPVFYVGEDDMIHQKLIKYAEFVENIDIYNHDRLVPEFVKLITFLNYYKNQYNYDKWASDVLVTIRKNIKVGISLDDIAAQCNMSYENLRKKFKKVFGCSLKDYIIQLRINEAKNMMINNNMPISEVSYTLGYCDSFAFCKQFRNQTGVYPGKFIKDNEHSNE